MIHRHKDFSTRSSNHQISQLFEIEKFSTLLRIKIRNLIKKLKYMYIFFLNRNI